MTFGGAWSTQQLAEFTAALSAAPDEALALRDGVERAAEAFEAEVAAVVLGPCVAASIGWPRFDVPEAQLVALAHDGAGTIDVPGSGPVPATVLLLEGEEHAVLLLGRVGERLDAEERILASAMARTLALTLRALRTLEAERILRARSEAQARENAKLLSILRRRQRLQEGLVAIQRAISHRAPLTEVLEGVVAVAGEVLGDEGPGLLLLDPDAPGMLRTVASRGIPDQVLAATELRRVGEGVAGRAVEEGRLVVVTNYPLSPDAIPEFVANGTQAAMAAPVHDSGQVIGSLMVSSVEAGRLYSREEQQSLLAIAEHASLALTDARTVDTMVHQALHDSLTDLPNRALFLDRLEHALAQTARRGSAVAVLFCDLDRFKTVNDSLGHAAGDELLVAVADRLRSCMRAGDTAARLGGDEFALLLEDLGSPAEAVSVADRVLRELRTPIAIQGREVFVSASIGIAHGDAGAHDLLRHADVAMYRAKAEGKDRYAIFESSMQIEVLERLDMEADLQHALSDEGEGELVVYYQPIVELNTGTLEGFEALVRWLHPRRGLVAPMAFIPLAEETGLIAGIGNKVLRAACAQLAAWRRAHPGLGPWTMNVNLSGRQLDDCELVLEVADVLRETGLPPEALVLEITETVLMQDTDATIARLQELRDLGVRLAVDDFGTGYSSLRYLRRFPVDVLKIAKPFIDGLGNGADDSALARAIVEMGTSLRMDVIAEGIELPSQVEHLRALRCRLGQGFHFARPIPADAMTAALASPHGREWRLSRDHPAAAA